MFTKISEQKAGATVESVSGERFLIIKIYADGTVKVQSLKDNSIFITSNLMVKKIKWVI